MEAINNTVNTIVTVDITIPKIMIKAAGQQNPRERTKVKKSYMMWITLLNTTSVQLYNAIHGYDSGGYSKRAIAKMVHCGRKTVTKYLNGDYGSLCCKDFRSGMNKFFDYTFVNIKPVMKSTVSKYGRPIKNRQMELLVARIQSDLCQELQ
ncbi:MULTISPECIES: hypothetical protein [Blautia]|uniref:hypothetical protein n=1 Tax=Blautia TaxID=572511 RepID=UPI000BA38D6A|nr:MULTISPECIES: hypothetical protein [Blautia]